MPQLGKFRKFFINASAPSGAFDSGDYSQMLLVQSIGMTGARAVVDVSTMDDLFETRNFSGRRTVTITVSGLFTQTGDTGMEKAETAFLSDTQAAAKIWWLWTTDTQSDKERAGTGVISAEDIQSPDEGPETISYTIAVNTGDMSIQDVP